MPKITDILTTMDYGVAPEDNAHVKRWLDQHSRRFGHFIEIKDRTGLHGASDRTVLPQCFATLHKITTH